MSKWPIDWNWGRLGNPVLPDHGGGTPRLTIFQPDGSTVEIEETDDDDDEPSAGSLGYRLRP